MAETKERREKRLQKRNDKILARFEYWFGDKRMRYDDVLLKLEMEEFFLSQSTLEQIIMGRGYYKKTRKPGQGAVRVQGTQIKFNYDNDGKSKT